MQLFLEYTVIMSCPSKISNGSILNGITIIAYKNKAKKQAINLSKTQHIVLK